MKDEDKKQAPEACEREWYTDNAEGVLAGRYAQTQVRNDTSHIDRGLREQALRFALQNEYRYTATVVERAEAFYQFLLGAGAGDAK